MGMKGKLLDMKKSVNNGRFRAHAVRLLMAACLLFTSIHVSALGWTPTSCGLVLNFESGDEFLLSVMVDGTEYFVCDYPSWTGGKYSYAAGTYLKLIPTSEFAEEYTIPTWHIGDPLTHPASVKGENPNFTLDGICYTMWSSSGNTLVTSNGAFMYLGALSDNINNSNLCDVVFAVPTIRSTSADPSNTLSRGTDPFDGKTGVGYKGMTYREVYMFAIPRNNEPISYANAEIVTFNTTTTDIKRKVGVGNAEVLSKKGQAFYAYADAKHNATPRVLFHIYPLNKPFQSCPESFFFAWDVQNYTRYRTNKNNDGATYTDSSKIYTLDHLYCMEEVAETPYYQTDGMQIPPSDSTYYYVGRKNKYHNGSETMAFGSGGAISQFTSIRQLRVRALKDAEGADTLFTPKAGAYGRMVIDTTTSANNLGVSFEPAGYFLRTNSDLNVPMLPSDDGTYWTTEATWTITEDEARFRLKATLFTGPEFSDDDPGADIRGWSTMYGFKDIRLPNGDTIPYGTTGWARIYPGNASANGGIVFVPADANKYIIYDNNGHFGAKIPNQHAAPDNGRLTVQAPLLLADYIFTAWNTKPDGTGASYAPGDEVNLDTIPEAAGKKILHLYAQGRYTGSINVAISFLREDGKRYFLTHPGVAPRFARARHFDDWTNVWQGMEDVNNNNPNYLSSYKIIGHEDVCVECAQGEYVLDPRGETMYGGQDSLKFYEHFQPASEEYIGLYYSSPYTVVANDTWAGLFRSSEGWPTPTRPCVENTKISSSHYLTRKEGVITRKERGGTPADSVLFYDEETYQFDGGAIAAGTNFMISGVGVVDAHYIILPDTTADWSDEIVFDYHSNQQIEQLVWSKLIGKQLLAQMKVGNDTIYFHPNASKTKTTASDLRLSSDYRLTQTFTFIPDNRGGSLDTLREELRPSIRDAANEFCQILTSGVSSPMDIKDGDGAYIDICDTIRVRLTPRSTSKIKKYYGRWRTGAPGLHIDADGSRYRDIIVRTKTYHYGDIDTALVLTPAKETYNFGPLTGQSELLKFKLYQVVYHSLHTANHQEGARDIRSITDITTSQLRLTPGSCKFVSTSTDPGTYFDVIMADADSIRIETRSYNSAGERYDTLVISLSGITYEGKTYPAFQTHVPLMQTALLGYDLYWSAVGNDGKRYFITAGSGGLIYHDYTLNNSTLYQKGTSKQLKIGPKDAANTDNQYITPWTYAYVDAGIPNQLTLKIDSLVHRSFIIADGNTPTVSSSSPSALTYEFVQINVNDNGNYEEQVRLQYAGVGWLKFRVAKDGTKSLSLDVKDSATVFTWSYLHTEYSLLNNGTYPSVNSLEFNADRNAKTVQTRYKAERVYSMLLDNTITYLCRTEQSNMDSLTNADKEWKTTYIVTRIPDARTFDGDDPKISGLSVSTTASTLETLVTPNETIPTDVKIDGTYVNIVDTLDCVLTLKTGAPTYRFKDKWSRFKSVSDAHLKIPLICKTYHNQTFDTLACIVDDDQYNYTFPASITTGVNDSVVFVLHTERRRGSQTMDVDNHVISSELTSETDVTSAMDLSSAALAEVRLIDEFGSEPTWCRLTRETKNTLTVKCTANGIRSPRTAYLYLAYIVTVDEVMRFVNFRLSVSQPSYFEYANNQVLVHSRGASGDPLKADGRQQVHENKRVLYYYNPDCTPEADQDVELPLRERGFYGWWRWYEESETVHEADIPDSKWQTMPRNVGKFNYPYRIIGDSVDDPENPGKKKLVTMGRYTVFHYPSYEYKNKADPSAKVPLVYPPTGKAKVTYMVDISNYYDNLPLSTKYINQVDTSKLDTMQRIIEPTLSLREIFDLHPWTEMADTLEHYKDTIASSYRNPRYMEDHKVMAPIGNRLLLRTEQRYSYENLRPKYDKDGKLIDAGHSESLLGYYMRDDNWNDWESNPGRQDTMIWCGGWDVDCQWYTRTPSTGYSPCPYSITTADDFLNVPARAGISAGKDFDTVYYCLRARSKASTFAGDVVTTNDEGAYWFNICQYMVIYHKPELYGPLTETTSGGVTKALITNEEIEQTYEVLERLNFDYNKPGSEYTVYPHPLPWEDASYGYSYPMSPAIPDNRYHNDFAPNFPGVGEYGLINRILPKEPGKSHYWREMEQHGGAENGYMIYCDGMSSAGQVAALTLETQLCEGQRMYFSAYVGNCSSQSGKSNPNFTFSVQGKSDKVGAEWEDITSYMTGDIVPSSSWYQIFFPISFNQTDKDYVHFRVRIYNVASDFDGNDFIIDDMCLFATKPPLIAYQANSTCIEKGENDSITHVVVRVDYQGFADTSYIGKRIYYTVEKAKNNDTTFVSLIDGYLNETRKPKIAPATVDTIFGSVKMPLHTYYPENPDSIFSNLTLLRDTFESTLRKRDTVPATTLFNQGYIYETLDGVSRPVMYIIHKAKLTPDNHYKVRMSLSYKDLMSSICAMTSNLKVSNRMVLELNGEEQENMENDSLCANTTYDISLRVKGTLFQDGIAPMEVVGTCMNDWLIYGDTTETALVGKYTYSDVVKVVKDILRYEPHSGETNSNQFAPNLAAVSRDVMTRIRGTMELTTTDHPYEVLEYLVNNGYLTMYQSKLTANVMAGDSVQYVILPILGSGSEEVKKANVDICPAPIFVKLKPKPSQAAPLIIGGTMRDTRHTNLPVVIVADSIAASSAFTFPVDSIMPSRNIHSISLISTDDPNFREGVHTLKMTPNKNHPAKGENLVLSPHGDNNYYMRPGYSYTFGIAMATLSGYLEDGGCPVGTIPFTVSVVPYYLRWDPQTAEDNEWNNPNNWIGITQQNVPIQANARFAPLPGTLVIIPTLTDGRPYPVLSDIPTTTADSVKQIGFQYNKCSAIRFSPGTVIGRQELLTYDSTIIDMTTPYGKWALRAAPVKGMLSGDLYMADADLNWETSPWEVGEFDANGRNYNTGNASFWLSLYSRSITQKGNKDQVADTVRDAGAEWTRAVNAMTDSLQPAQGWAVFTRTATKKNATVRLPKKDDRFYYFTADGDRVDELYEPNLRTQRNTFAGGSGAGRMAFEPVGTSAAFALTNKVASQYFVFGNPTMAYIDIWGFIADNSLEEEISYLGTNGLYTTVSKTTALTTDNVITEQERYLPPMHAIVVKVAEEAVVKSVTINTSRVVTAAVGGGSGAPARNTFGRRKGIMTVTAVNPASQICTSRLLLGQGYSNSIRSGEDAVLTTVNVNNFSSSTLSTPFNIYATEGEYGLSIDLRDEVVNVPISFHMSPLPFDSETYLWFTGVNNIDGSLVLYDALTDTERSIIDGICLDIETPENSHETRYYIRLRGWSQDDPITTDEPTATYEYEEKAGKIIRDGHVFILRNGHVYTMFGQKIR